MGGASVQYIGDYVYFSQAFRKTNVLIQRLANFRTLRKKQNILKITNKIFNSYIILVHIYGVHTLTLTRKTWTEGG